MKNTQTSTTAKGIAAMRAIESERPINQRICYDPLARKFTTNGFYYLSKWFARYGERVAPGTQGYLLCRYRYFDDYIAKCIGEDFTQLIILGAGLDSRGYREDIVKAGVKTFEVDKPRTQSDKIRQVGKVLGGAPQSLVYVPIDFNEESLDKLLSFGFDRLQRALFVWEGVTYYLSADAVDGTLGWIRTNAAPGSSVIFDYVDSKALSAEQKRGEIKRMQRYQRFTGEGLVFGIQKDHVVDFMKKRGYINTVSVDAAALTRLYCRGANESRKVADVYAIVHSDIT
jgi:methyltransferase (TIGR00027 family)